ncbi:adenosylhomocysteinase [Bifidobacterium sp.]|uniref:adenosylhomocysteinase n=1 Tax=Bifidobacterium sp. TaxID=41200 RepID=UPI0025BD5E70|nr:adenosylhomocysteinase [Bifidobacterium sp.]MCH4208959.1 adenosylhomocysteinase [Bifidobacterium sp.]MCI1224958.1 adenosylhomocysteinase [Bifidobacterium sp.]
MTTERAADFASWACRYSQRTNRSLAGAHIVLPETVDALSASTASRSTAEPAPIAAQSSSQAQSSVPLMPAAAQQWGMVPVDADQPSQPDPGQFLIDATISADQVPDMRLATGAAAMDYAQEHMVVLRTLMAQLRGEIDFTGVRIAVCLILEPKTAVLLRALHAAGAIVGVFGGPDTTDQRVARQLRAEGIVVEADTGWDARQTHEAALRLLDEIRPEIIVDDGASFARLASLERPELMRRLIGVAEETTSGVRAFQAMQDADELNYPVVAVNDSTLKTGFDNAHGTGETCVTTLQRILGEHVFAGAKVAVIGYGPVGRGFALRIRALGAQVTICDTDPVACLKAVFEGFAAQDIDDALPAADIVISATGVRHTITLDHLQRMRGGAVLSVIGGIANEIALDDIPDFVPQIGRDSMTLTVSNGPTITLIADGDGVNYTVGGGNPIEIMDLSFAVQVSAVTYLLQHCDELDPGLLRLDAQSDRRIATIALEARGCHASHATVDNGYDWRLTRFAEEDAARTRSCRGNEEAA